jgi:hypothetical protein
VILDVATASIATGVPARTIQRWALDGRITDHGDGMTIRVDPDEVEELRNLRDSLTPRRLPIWRPVA